MAKDSRYKREYRKNASKLHKAVGEVLRTDFKNWSSFQEYPVNKVNTGYHSGAHKFDWVVPSLLLVIECHGRQHYEPVAFDGDVDKSIDSFRDIKLRDKTKKIAALDAGWRYLEISYKELKTVTAALIIDKIKGADEELLEHEQEFGRAHRLEDKRDKERKERNRATRTKYMDSDAHKQRLEQARVARRDRYRALKESKNGPRQ